MIALSSLVSSIFLKGHYKDTQTTKDMLALFESAVAVMLTFDQLVVVQYKSCRDHVNRNLVISFS